MWAKVVKKMVKVGKSVKSVKSGQKKLFFHENKNILFGKKKDFS